MSSAQNSEIRTREFLEGERATLRAFRTEDLPFLHAWLNDPDVTHYMTYGQRPLTSAQTEAFIRGHVDNPQNTVFIICMKETGSPIGLAGIYDVEEIPKRGEYRIMIGDRRCWGQGIGTEVAHLLTWFAFDRLNLHRLFLGVNAENVGAVASYKKAGFQQEGVLRDEMYRNGRYYDMVRMAILRPWYEEHLRPTYDARFNIRGAAMDASPPGRVSS